MENKFIYKIFAFSADGFGRYGIILVAANNKKDAFEYLMTTRYAKNYQIHFEKEAINLYHNSIEEFEDKGKIIFKNWIEI